MQQYAVMLSIKKNEVKFCTCLERGKEINGNPIEDAWEVMQIKFRIKQIAETVVTFYQTNIEVSSRATGAALP